MKFGIMGPGGIAHRFANAVAKVDGVTINAVASRNYERASAFADEFGIENAYGSYDEMLKNADIDAVYISTVNTTHFECAKMSILAGRSVLCEKPMCLTEKESAELFELAKANNVLLMEGLWTLFLPCVIKAKEWMDSGRIGTIKYLDSAFSFLNPVNPSSRLFDPAQGGGGLYDVGIYTYCFTLFMMGAFPKDHYGRFYVGSTGVDEVASSILTFDNNVVATCVSGVQATIDDTAHIYGEHGQIALRRFWGCTHIELRDEQGKVVDEYDDPEENGFVYEIKAFANAFRNGLSEVTPATRTMSLDCIRIIENILK